MKNILFKNIALPALFLGLISFFYNSSASADVNSTAVTAGNVAHSQGTKASESYEAEGRAGGPIYEYGKGIYLGPAHFIPAIGYQYSWMDNVFYDERGIKSDYVSRLNTDLTGELPLGGGQHLVTMSYITSTEWFERFRSQNHTDQTVAGGVKLNYVPFSLNVEDHFLRTEDRSGTEFTQRIQRDENTAHALLEIPFAAFFLETESFDLNEDYRQAADQSFTHNNFDFYQRVGIDISGNNQFLAEYGYTHIDYTNSPFNRDGNANQFALGLRGNLTERISYQVWGGAQYRIYDESSLPDFNGFIMRAAAEYAISDASHVALKLDRSPQESTFDNQSFYVRDHSELTWRQQIADRLFFNTTEAFDYNEYSRVTVLASKQEVRKDYVWGASAGLEYVLPNNLTSLTLDYHLNGRVSNLDGSLGYDANEVTAGIRTSF